MAKSDDVFETLRLVDVSEHVEEKDTGKAKLKYLSWAWAWHEVRRRCPDATYTIVKNEQGLPYFVDPQIGIMVYTTVTIGGETHEMWLPVMNGANDPMKLEPYDIQTKWGKKHVEAASMFDINKTVMRCLTKNLAMFGIGLALYAGEDLFDDAEGNKGAEAVENTQQMQPQKTAKTTKRAEPKNAPSAAAMAELEAAPEPAQNMLGLDDVIKTLDNKFKAMTAAMSDEQKDVLAAVIKAKCGMVNYRLCKDVVALNELLVEINKPKAA